ncbi:hypothetical protein SAMN02745121_08254 [Nannocystis exedens]|uniref:Uncharacterized protein n=1 Tax=Nannocystis exedens TaxID=54 RepID=A0A1I2HWX5_9BACT|nr:hypothetical protein NAEX_05095 [Nannocystis exedens]SFF34028.1 hypothetical protein SAMN02745121_08254 [Nannocystis exedens]
MKTQPDRSQQHPLQSGIRAGNDMAMSAIANRGDGSSRGRSEVARAPSPTEATFSRRRRAPTRDGIDERPPTRRIACRAALVRPRHGDSECPRRRI